MRIIPMIVAAILLACAPVYAQKTPSEIKAEIDSTVRSNGVGAITGAGLNSVLTDMAAAANLGFTPRLIFNVRDYGTNIGAAGSSGDDNAFTNAETAACAYGATSGAPGTSKAVVVAPEGYQYSLSAEHDLNCQNSYDILGQVNSSKSSGAVFVINSIAPALGQNQLADFHIASCVQVNGNTSTPTGVNTSGGICVEVRNMQFFRSFRVDQHKQFTYTGVYFNASNDHYTGQNIQQNTNIYLGLGAYEGVGFKVLSYSGAAGAFNVNVVRWADLVSNYHQFDIDDATHYASSSNDFYGSMEPVISGGSGGTNYSYWNMFHFTYQGAPMVLGAGATGNYVEANNSAATGATMTDNSGNATNIMLPAGADRKYALAAALAGYFPASSISSAAISFGANSVSVAAINGGAALAVAETFSAKQTFAPSTTAEAMLNLQQGVAPTSPVNGDIWMTSAGLYYRLNGTTHGPL